MPLPYTLHQNAIRKASGADAPSADKSATDETTPETSASPITYRAVAKDVTYVGIEDAIRALTRSGSILKHTECFAVIHSFLDYLNEQVAEGNGFLSPYFRLTPGIRGVFSSDEDAYDPRRHRPSVNFRPGKRMQQAMQRMKVRSLDAQLPAPAPSGFQDWKSDASNRTVTPGHSGVVTGERLKITDPSDSEQGVFFIHLLTRQRYRASDVHHNYPQQLLISVPESLPPGDYRLEVRSAFGTIAPVRTGILAKTLTVEAPLAEQ